jgi:DUF438 domain-containing protein
MEVSKKTKVGELLDVYPELLTFLLEKSSHFNRLNNPVMRKTVAKVATLEHAAGMAELDLAEFLDGIRERIAEIKARRKEEALQPQERQEALKGIIRDLHAGHDMDELKQRFRLIIQGVEAGEVARMEQALMDEGLEAEEIKRLCDVHVEIFKEALEAQDAPEPPPGHPVHSFMKENRFCEKILSSIAILLGRVGQPVEPEAFERHRDELAALIGRLQEVGIHYTRKENQLFPFLEDHHFTGPSQVMWALHDDIRGFLKSAAEGCTAGKAQETVDALNDAVAQIREMIYKEEHILFPASLEMLSDSEWLRLKEGEADIGYAWITPDEGWPSDEQPVHQPEPVRVSQPVGEMPEAVLNLSTGQLSLKKLDLMLRHLPVDLTFVDADDRVAYYSEGPERIFPRSPAVIGREVRNCHPPKSVHKVNRILDEFKAGSKDNADFWIQLNGRFLYIRYFALRDEAGYYQGCLEVSQDLTEIKQLSGEKRLLDWE